MSRWKDDDDDDDDDAHRRRFCRRAPDATPDKRRVEKRRRGRDEDDDDDDAKKRRIVVRDFFGDVKLSLLPWGGSRLTFKPFCFDWREKSHLYDLQVFGMKGGLMDWEEQGRAVVLPSRGCRGRSWHCLLYTSPSPRDRG